MYAGPSPSDIGTLTSEVCKLVVYKLYRLCLDSKRQKEISEKHGQQGHQGHRLLSQPRRVDLTSYCIIMCSLTLDRYNYGTANTVQSRILNISALRIVPYAIATLERLHTIVLEFNRIAGQALTVYVAPSARSLISATSPSFQLPDKADTVYPQRSHPGPPLRSGGRTHPLVLSRSPRTRQSSLDDRPSTYRTYITILSNGPHALP